ncbi:MAG: hypothetical protein UV73_C0003G0154 [Candidatus Gottesmanbacteria bacterium GW2011_GWA2_43_14]|uniref:Toxin-antitoxin system HicB family antitoxin n=1 Tax=Candidatus Gottesmanbacteria bacterium GW2011_GWA2_43_14 TaxID=1618443 RepID=A0A0G1DKX2_9BACT|nr:MAG: hypothetical protein UV73_C0003G0154 [Candidatus Gottesmanbacteria bacterium GW2011_GWA2_43_14]
MTVKKIVTNLRIPEDEWLQVRSTAASQGISVNEYISRLIRTENVKSILGKREIKSPPRGYEALIEFAKSKTMGKGLGASPDDMVIYGIEDE